MQTRTFSLRIATGAAILAAALVSATPMHAQQQKSHGFGGFLRDVLSAMGNPVLGNWQGSKIENDPIHGGYLSLNFAFAFAADGTYQEAAFMGGRKVMTASGTYQLGGNRLAFSPQECSFASPELGQTIKFFPIPTDAPAEDVVSLSPLEGGSQMSLKDTASGDQWGLKPAR